jgi:hypothetical protein
MRMPRELASTGAAPSPTEPSVWGSARPSSRGSAAGALVACAEVAAVETGRIDDTRREP